MRVLVLVVMAEILVDAGPALAQGRGGTAVYNRSRK